MSWLPCGWQPKPAHELTAMGDGQSPCTDGQPQWQPKPAHRLTATRQADGHKLQSTESAHRLSCCECDNLHASWQSIFTCFRFFAVEKHRTTSQLVLDHKNVPEKIFWTLALGYLYHGHSGAAQALSKTAQWNRMTSWCGERMAVGHTGGIYTQKLAQFSEYS